MGGNLPGSEVVKFEDVLNEALLLRVNGPPLTAGIHHLPDFLLADLLLVPFGVHVQQPQNSVDRDGQEPNQGSKKFGNGADETRHSQGQLLRLFHGQPLRHQLAEHQGKVGQNNGDQNHRNGVQGLGGNAHPQTHKPLNQKLRKVICSKGAAQKAGQGNGHLNGGQEPGGLHRQLPQSGGLPVTVGGHALQLGLAHRQDRNLRTGKDGVEANQQNLQQKLP